MSILFYVKIKVDMNKYENCVVQNASILEIEKTFDKKVNSYLKVFLEDKPSENVSLSAKWIQMENIYIYSVFLELCPLEFSFNTQFCVKFIGALSFNASSVSPFSSSIKCIFKNNSHVSEGIFATIERLPEDHFKPYTGAYLFCPVTKLNFTHASLYDKLYNLTWLPIENNIFPTVSNIYLNNAVRQAINSPQGLSLCIRPLYSDLSVINFSEFLAYYSMMGVDHFIFYYLETFKSLDMFLKFLKFTNISNEVHMWNIPLDNDIIHEYGQMIFTQDCISRSKYKFTHTIIVDLDEYIVPQVRENIKSLNSYLDYYYPYAGSYVIPMVLFCDEYSVENFDISPFHVLNHNKRQKTHWQHKFRSKYIIRPNRVRYGGVHFVWKFESYFKEIYLSSDIAQLNHYRLCCGMRQTWLLHLLQFKVLNDQTVIDDNLMRFESELVNNGLLKFIFNIIFEKI